MKSDIEKHFNLAIDEMFKGKEEIIRFLKNHPRKNLCIMNLCEQIDICERKSYSIIWNLKTYSKTINDVARMFAKAALKYAEEQNLSSIERIRQQTEAGREADLNAQLEEWKRDGTLIERTETTELGADNGPTKRVDVDDSV